MTADGSSDLATDSIYDGWTTTVDPPGAASAATSTVLDPFGRTTRTIESNNNGVDAITRYAYNVLDLPTSIADHDLNTTIIGYDHAGRALTNNDPSSGLTTTAYDNAGNVKTIATAAGKTVAYTYDVLNRRTKAWAGAEITGTLLAEWFYDTVPGALGQLHTAVRHDLGGDYSVSVDGYSDRYQPTARTWTLPAVEGSLARSYAYTYAYNLQGKQTTIGYPAVGDLPAETVTTGFDDLGLADTLTSSLAGGNYVTGTQYDDIGRVQQRLLGATAAGTVTRSYHYDTLQRLDRLTTATPSETVRDDNYGFTPEGTIDYVTDNGATGVGQTECFDYDSRNRLAAAYTTTAGCGTPNNAGPDPYNETYGYDHLNRMTTRGTSTYTYDGAHPYQLTSGNGVGYSHNPDGTANTRTTASHGTQIFGWDSESRLSTTTDTVTPCLPFVSCQQSNLYDADGLRLVRRSPDGTATAYIGPDEVTSKAIGVEQLGQWGKRNLDLGLGIIIGPTNGTITSGPTGVAGDRLLVATVSYRHWNISLPNDVISLTDNQGGTWTKQAESASPNNLLNPSARIAAFTRTTTAPTTGLQLTATAANGLLNLYAGWDLQLTAYTNATIGVGAGSTSTGTTPLFTGGPASITTGTVPVGGRVHAGIAQTQPTSPGPAGAIQPTSGEVELAETATPQPNQQIQYEPGLGSY